MNISLSERILCVIRKRLESIRTEDGYSTSAGLHVSRARRSIKAEELPAVVLWAGAESSQDKEVYGKFNNQLSVSVEGLVHVDRDDTGEMLEKIKADIKRALFSGNRNGGITDDDGLKAAMYFDGCTPFPREDGSLSESVTVNLIVTYPENVGRPDQQQ